MVLKYENFPNLPTAKDLPCSDDTPVDSELQDLIPHLLNASRQSLPSTSA